MKTVILELICVHDLFRYKPEKNTTRGDELGPRAIEAKDVESKEFRGMSLNFSHYLLKQICRSMGECNTILSAYTK